MKRDFEGVFIPAHLWLREDLTPFEKFVLAEVGSLDSGDGCYASNEYLAKFLNTTPATVANKLSKLRGMGLIIDLKFDGRMRWIRSAYKLCKEPQVKAGLTTQLSSINQPLNPEVPTNKEDNIEDIAVAVSDSESSLGNDSDEIVSCVPDDPSKLIFQNMASETLDPNYRPPGVEDPPNEPPKEPESKPTTGTKRRRNDLLDALVTLNGENLNEVTGPTWSRAAKALSIIKEVCPDVTVDEIKRRRLAYIKEFVGCSLTCTAIASNWARLGNATNKPRKLTGIPNIDTYKNG